MGGIDGVHGNDAGTGQECPAQQPSNALEETRKQKVESRNPGRQGASTQQKAESRNPAGREESENLLATAEEQAAIRAMLSKRAESAPAGAGVGRAPALAWAGLKLATMVLLSAGVVVGYADGDEFDDVGCTVAQQPGGSSHGARSAQARERAGGKVPGSDGGSAGPSGGGGAGGQPECEVRAAECPNRTAEGECRILQGRCRLVGRQNGPSRTGQECGAPTGELMAVLGEIRREIADVKAACQENVTARKRLEEAMAEGLLKFLGRVDAQALRVVYAVLAKGDLAKAARELKMKDSTLRDLVGKWKGMGKDHAVLADLVRWRKDTKFKGTVPLNEAVLAGQTSNVDYGGLIADVLDGLLMMTEGNWEDKREELAELLRPVAG